MAKLKRTEEREEVFFLLFEKEFRPDETDDEIFHAAAVAREHEETAYIRDTYCGICEKCDAIDQAINENAKGWRVARLSRVSRAVLRLGAYEVLYNEKIPDMVAIDEAVELSKRYGEEKSHAFVNGILNAIKDAKDKKPTPEMTETTKAVTEGSTEDNAETATVTEGGTETDTEGNTEGSAETKTEEWNGAPDLSPREEN